MGYSKEIYALALEKLRDKIKAQKSNNQNKIAELCKCLPEFNETENKIKQNGPLLLAAVFSGKSTENIKKETEKLKLKRAEILKKYGIEIKDFNCEICKDELFVNGKYCSCVKTVAEKLALEQLFQVSCAENCGFDNFETDVYPENVRAGMQKLKDFCQNYTNNFSKNSTSLLFMGNTGLGKTHLSLAIAKAVIEKGYGVLYGSAANLLSEAEKEHFSYSDKTPKMDSLLNCDLLIIDDLGTEFNTKFTQSTVYDIINTRINKKLPTVISTNLDVDEIENMYSERIVSRFIGNYSIKLFKGDDIRQIKAFE